MAVDPFAQAAAVAIPKTAKGGKKAREIAAHVEKFFNESLLSARREGQDWISQAYTVPFTPDTFGPSMSDLRLLASKTDGVTLSVKYDTKDEKDVTTGNTRKVPVFDDNGICKVTVYAFNTKTRTKKADETEKAPTAKK